ncbi:MAG: substrate-binding domain-containing protein [Mycobacteriaceae bacterium]|nr:substrate-binding domain-containing protein [Mycobacteriaceae bacterium]
MGRHRRSIEDAAGEPDPLTGPLSTGGGHRSQGGRRGVSIGVIVALVAVIVVVAIVVAWQFFGEVLSDRSHTVAGRCIGSKQTVAVIADPSIVEQVQEFADRSNGVENQVGDHCMVVTVKPADSNAVIHGLAGDWPAELGDRPALWIPGSSISKARLVAAAGQHMVSDSRSLVTSPVLIALRPELHHALSNQSWATLPALQAAPDGLAGMNLPAWGSLRLALPLAGNADAAYLAGEAVAAASAPPDSPLMAQTAQVRTLIYTQPKLADDSLAEAMNVLLGSGDSALAPVHAVVTTEQQLFHRGRSLPNATATLSSWLPAGPVAIADYPTVLLNGDWLSPEQVTAASGFARFMHKPDQLAGLAKAGFRVPGIAPPRSDVTSFAELPAPQPVGDDAVRAALADALIPSAIGPAATIVLDQSMPTNDGGQTRLANVLDALDRRIQTLPPTAMVGLWTFNGADGRMEVPVGPLTDLVNGQPRLAALTTALSSQHSSPSGNVSFTTLRLVYQDALAHFQPDRPNSVLVITTGPHTDRTLDGPGLQDFIQHSLNPTTPVAINVIDFGADPDQATWAAIAQLTGGSYHNLTTSASPELAAVINTYLS